jgi:hypothetical protein
MGALKGNPAQSIGVLHIGQVTPVPSLRALLLMAVSRHSQHATCVTSHESLAPFWLLSSSMQYGQLPDSMRSIEMVAEGIVAVNWRKATRCMSGGGGRVHSNDDTQMISR